jgi:hypothetical protein
MGISFLALLAIVIWSISGSFRGLSVGVAAIYGKVGRTDSRQSSGRACEPGDGGDDVENDTRRTSNAIRDPTSSSKPIIPGELAARNEWMQLPVPATTASVTASSPAGRRQDQGKHEEPLPGQSTGTGHHGRRATGEMGEMGGYNIRGYRSTYTTKYSYVQTRTKQTRRRVCVNRFPSFASLRCCTILSDETMLDAP